MNPFASSAAQKEKVCGKMGMRPKNKKVRSSSAGSSIKSATEAQEHAEKVEASIQTEEEEPMSRKCKHRTRLKKWKISWPSLSARFALRTNWLSRDFPGKKGYRASDECSGRSEDHRCWCRRFHSAARCDLWLCILCFWKARIFLQTLCHFFCLSSNTTIPKSVRESTHTWWWTR